MPASDARSLVAAKTFVDSTEPPTELPIGRVIDERYRICGTIGRGGMGVVYEAQHSLIGRKVALKTIAAHSALSAAAIERFRREAQAAASVGSSHVVDVLDMGRLEGGSFYMVLEHLDGSDLAFVVAAGGPLAPEQALRVAGQLCDALSAVHGAGIVHRDLKPENVFLIERDGTPDFVKVLDFGVCKLLAPPGAALTATGDLVGTPQFMAPEQIDGGVSDHRTDIHALGAIVFFLFAGRPPYEAPTLSKLFVTIANQPPPSLRALHPELPAALDAVVHRALDKDPERRFQSCQALKAALLAAFEQGSDVSATLVDSSVRADRAPENDSTAELSRGLRTLRARSLKKAGLLAATGSGLALGLGWYASSKATNVEVPVEALGRVDAAASASATEMRVVPAPEAPASVRVARREDERPPLSPRRAGSDLLGERRTRAPAPELAAPSLAPSAEPPSWQSAIAAPAATNSAAPRSTLNRGLKHGL